MPHFSTRLGLTLALVSGAVLLAQTRATPQERRQAEADRPALAAVLELAPGMTLADVGAGAGATSLAFAGWLGPSGRVYSTDINRAQLPILREQAAREHLDNVVVLEGAQGSTNLPDACCDAIVLRDVYHHLTNPAAIDRSLRAALKPGGRLAIVDFPPAPGSGPPPGVPANRIGHGITADIVERELQDAGFTVLKTIGQWPPGPPPGEYFLVLARKAPSSPVFPRFARRRPD